LLHLAKVFLCLECGSFFSILFDNFSNDTIGLGEAECYC
jgi:hypothetical protein